MTVPRTPRQPRGLALPLGLLLGCVPPSATTAPSTAPTAAPSVRVAPAVADDLGPAEAEEPVPEGPTGPPFAFDEDGPARIFGTRGDGRRRPDAPGRAGTLRVAIDTPYELFGRASSYVHVVAWRPDGRPAAGARVFVGRTAVGRTDTDGTLVFRHRTPETKPDDDDDDGVASAPVFVIDGGRCGAVDFSPHKRTPTFASDEIYVYTDRGVYRPGETVHVRVIGWRLQADYAPVVGGDVELLLRDRDGHSLAAATIHTDEFGAGTADLRVPVTADQGDYDLSIAYQNARESTELQIRRFEAPQIRIDHTLPRHLSRDRTTLPFTVTARPSAGGAIGKHRIDVEATGAKGRTVKLGRDVDGAGPHGFELTRKQLGVLRDGLDQGRPITTVVRVRDARGREDATIRTIDVSNNPYVAVLEPDKDAYATGDEVVVVARISDLDDVAVRQREVELGIGSDGGKLRGKTDRGGIATFRFPMPSKAQTVELRLGDVDTPIATAHIGWTAPLAMSTALSEAVVREHAKVALVAKFPRGHEPVDRRVHVDITDTSGAIVGATILRASRHDGAWIARGEIIAPTWGSALFTFFALGRGELDAREKPTRPGDPVEKDTLGLLVAGQEIVVVPDRELTVELTGLPARATPGAAIEVEAVVRDRRGRPVEFAGSAAIVDSAVLALHDPLEITPMDRFYDPLLRTLGTTGAQMLTWPVVTRNWGDNRWDVALPPFAFLGGGETDACESFWDPQDHRAFAKANGLTMYGIGSGGGGTGEGSIGLGSIGTIGHGAGAGTPTITVRKRFGDTSLWLPDLRGRGKATVRGTLPDTIGEQEIVVVASDRRGGVGVARERIAVDQALFVEADLPDVSIVGERLEIPVLVHNRGETGGDFGVSLQGARTKLRVGANDVGATMLALRHDTPGRRPVVVEASGSARIDRVERDVFVVPAGVPVATVRSEVATKGKPVAFDLAGTAGATAHLRVEVPAITAAFVGLDDLLDTVTDDPWSLASDLSAAAVLLQLADRHGLRSDRLADLRGQAIAAIAMTSRVQASSGAFGYWRNGVPSPWITATVLDGLLEARAAGLRVPAKTVTKAAGFLAAKLPGGQLGDVRDIGWWEGDDAAIKRALEAEIFAVLARLPAAERTGEVAELVDAMATRAEATLETSSDVRALASATIGLLRLGRIDRERAAAIAERLIAARNDGHWEPTWFSAWGGNIEATTVALEALALASPTGFATAKRDALRWLLATRPGWGSWHGERGTVAALRAIAAVGAPRIEGTSTIRVAVDGKDIARVRIDPADPLASAMALAHVDIAAAAIDGKHRVTVESDGALAPTVTLVANAWRTGKTARAERSGLVLTASGVGKLVAGDPGALVITAKGRRLGGATLRIAGSGLVDVDVAALADRLGRGGPVAEIRPVAGALELRLSPTVRELDLQLPVLAHRRGVGRWPAVALVPVTQGSAPATPLVVDPGALAIE